MTLQMQAVRLRPVLFALAWFATAHLGHITSLTGLPFATFWPAAGLAVGVFARIAPTKWAELVLIGVVSQVVYEAMIQQTGLRLALLSGVTHAFHGVIGGGILRWLSGPRLSLLRLIDLSRLVLLAAPLSAAGSASLAVMLLLGDYPRSEMWFGWWVGCLLGVLVLAPGVLVFTDKSLPWHSWRLGLVWVEAAALLLVAGVLNERVFSVRDPHSALFPFWSLPVLLWAALRFGLFGVVILLPLQAILIFWHTAHGQGPFALHMPTPLLAMGQAQGFQVVIGLMGLCLASVLSAREHAAEALHQAERFARGTLDALPLRLCVLDAEGTILAVNRAWRESQVMSSSTPLVAEGTNYLTLCDAATAGEATQARELAAGIRDMLTGKCREFSMEYPGNHGSPRWFQVRVMRFANGLPPRLVLTYEDITQRRQAEVRLRLLSRAIESSPASILITNPAGNIEYVNPQFERVTGYTAAEVLGQNPRLLRSGLIDPSVYSQMWETILAGQEWRGEFLNRKKDGELFWELASISPVRDESGTITHYVAVKEDITARKQAEQELRDSRELAVRLRQELIDAIECLNDGFALYDAEDRLVLCNSRYREFYDLSGDLLVPGARFEEYIRTAVSRGQMADAIGREEEWIRERLEQHHNPQGTYLQRLGNGRWLEVRERRTHAGGIVGVRIDITQRIEAEEQLRRRLREKEALLREIHHRVKNNLQIVSSLMYLQRTRVKDAGVAAVLQESEARVRSMALVHESLYGQGDLARVDVRRHLGRLCEYLRGAYGMTGDRVRLQTDIAPLALDLDRTIPLSLLVTELVANAFKYAFPGDRAGEVRVRLTEETPGHYRLDVADDGIGWPEGLDFRHTETLGLQLVCTLVGQLGGSIERAARSGTHFTITFDVPGAEASG